MTNLAYATSARSPRVPLEVPEQPRHIEIISTRSQRRARPRLVYALFVVAGLFVILVAQLLLSIVLSDGAYQISALQTTQTNLSRDQQTLTEQLNVLQSPQNLSAQAENLGMILNNTTPAYLRLSDGAVLGSPKAATAATGTVVGTDSVPNSLLGTDGDEGVQTAQTPGSGAPTTTTQNSSVPSNPGALPSPITH